MFPSIGRKPRDAFAESWCTSVRYPRTSSGSPSRLAAVGSEENSRAITSPLVIELSFIAAPIQSRMTSSPTSFTTAGMFSRKDSTTS